jgi:hypothetical protein
MLWFTPNLFIQFRKKTLRSLIQHFSNIPNQTKKKKNKLYHKITFSYFFFFHSPPSFYFNLFYKLLNYFNLFNFLLFIFFIQLKTIFFFFHFLRNSIYSLYNYIFEKFLVIFWFSLISKNYFFFKNRFFCFEFIEIFINFLL